VTSPLPPAQLDRVLETALYVADLPRARAFYVDVLGCAPLLDTPRLVALDVAGQSVLLLFQRGATEAALPTPGGVVPGHGAAGVQHLAFAVAADALPAWTARLAAAGVPVESRVRWPRGGSSLYLRDPDGHSLELVTPGLWAIY
jgi:catechol 2,3-dioxygenase-like lactoylglutathione lyase family enzyme